MNTLEKIIEHKRIEVKEREALYPIELLKQTNYFKSPTVSLSAYLKGLIKLASSQNSKSNLPLLESLINI